MEEEYLYLDLASDEGKAMLKVAEEWLRSAYGSMENLDILEIFVCNDEVFAELNIFDSGKYYAASRRIPDEWLRRHKRDCMLKYIGI